MARNQGRINNRLAQGSVDRLSMGDRAPILSGSGRRPPDRRQVSFRWLSGTFLTGITSSLLMGGALYASLEGRQKAELPTSFLNSDSNKAGTSKVAEKGDRTIKVLATSSSTSSIMDVPTMTRMGDSNVVRKRPFAHASAPLAIASKSKLDYPRFNPLTIFSASKDNEFHSGSNDLIYGADVESEVTIRQGGFPLGNTVYEQQADLSAAEVESIVRKIAPSLEDGATSVSAIPFFNASRFTLAGQLGALSNFPGITITAENVSEFSPVDPEKPLARNFYETVITIRQEQPIQLALSAVADDEAANKVISDSLASPLSSTDIKTGYKLRVALETLS